MSRSVPGPAMSKENTTCCHVLVGGSSLVALWDWKRSPEFQISVPAFVDPKRKAEEGVRPEHSLQPKWNSSQFPQYVQLTIFCISQGWHYHTTSDTSSFKSFVLCQEMGEWGVGWEKCFPIQQRLLFLKSFPLNATKVHHQWTLFADYQLIMI